MSTEKIETVIIGAGQAGLATGYHLQRCGRPFLILDANSRVGDGWRAQWDTLRLYSPAKYDGLPGMAFPAPGWSFPAKDEVADFLESYVGRFGLPVRLGTRVDRVAADNGGYAVSCGDQTILADNIVIATGTFGRTAFIPGFADQLDPGIMQLHSSEYRRPSQLRPGPVLVVGASHSGGDVAYEVADTHPTILCGRDTGHIPVAFHSPVFKAFFPVLLFIFRHVLTRRTPIGRKEMDEFRFHGGPALRVQAKDLAGRGVERVTDRVVGVKDGLPVLDGGRVIEPANVVWCTGFRQAYGWVDVPVFGHNGWPEEMRGVVDKAPGLYFCGLGFQYAASSMLIAGAGRDAAYVAKRIDQRSRTSTGAGVRVA
ncbi:MAG: NAD(P)/FAD-dependent oxidoreductase [Actinomycetota bacterium]|nr:NAD(P)/FAD-dependent oxidoreductase [Actinomycetota bacterium]